MLQHLIRTRFNRAADTYDKHAWLQEEIGRRLLEKLDILKQYPTQLLELGQGTGTFTLALQRYYQSLHPKIKIQLIGIDCAYKMCHLAKKKCAPKSWLSYFKKTKQAQFIQGNAEQLPFSSARFDLLISNCMVEWSKDLPRLFKECHRVLKINGTLFFSTLGPDSLQELKYCTQQISPYTHVHDFIDMHDIGDILLSNHFTDPIMDMEKITTYYPNVKSLLCDLKKIGATNLHPKRLKGLMGKNWLDRLETEYQKLHTPQGLPVTWEVVYGHGVKTKPYPTTWQDAEGKIFTSVQKIT